MKRIVCLVLVAVIASAFPAAAKGHVEPRGYVVLTGPGLRHPIVISAPWNPRWGGYYGTEAEYFIGLAESTGAISVGNGKVSLGRGDFDYEGVLPIAQDIHPDALGPRYRLTWFRDGLDAVVEQDFYPNVGNGLPYVFTHPDSRRGLLTIFGRFQAPRSRVWTGWGKASDGNLLHGLQARGLPKVPPVHQKEGAVASSQPSTVAVLVPTTTSDVAASRIPLAILALLAALTAVALLLSRRRAAVV
jgi:hypothetical protein